MLHKGFQNIVLSLYHKLNHQSRSQTGMHFAVGLMGQTETTEPSNLILILNKKFLTQVC